MCLLWHSWYLTHSKRSTQHMLCRDPMKEGVWTLCFREGPQQFLTSVFSFFPVGGHCEDQILGEGSRNAGQQARRGVCSSCDCEAILALKVGSYGKFCPWFTNISTMCLGEVPEFQLLGVEVCEARRQIYRHQIICYSFSISYKWLSETKFSIPNWAFKNKNRTLQRANTFHCKRAQAGNEPFLKNSMIGSGKVAVQGDWRLVWEMGKLPLASLPCSRTPWWPKTLDHSQFLGSSVLKELNRREMLNYSHFICSIQSWIPCTEV